MEKEAKVLILGARGMLGQELARVYGEAKGATVAAWDLEDIDVTDFHRAEKKIRTFAPTLIFNCVAYNAVDQCEESEEEFSQALLLNAEVPKFLASLAQSLEATLIHYSTDYVFDGKNKTGYAEDALPHPISKYGESKWQGEKNVEEVGGQYYLIRLSKLFGKPAKSALGKKSFFQKLLESAQEKRELTIVDEERSRFTYAPDLALASRVLVTDRKPWGIYHLTNEGVATWYEAAQELMRLTGRKISLRPVPASVFPRPAKRPRFSELLNTKFIKLRPYPEALREYLQEGDTIQEH